MTGCARRRRLLLLATVVALAMPIPLATAARAGVDQSPKSCAELFAETPLDGLRTPKGCRPIDRTLIAGTQGVINGVASQYLSAPGSLDSVTSFYAKALKREGFEVERFARRPSDCGFTLETYLRFKFRCSGVSFTRDALKGQVDVTDCNTRMQVAVSYTAADFLSSSGVPCLDPKGTGGVVRKRDAQRYLVDRICGGGFTYVETYPAARYAIDAVNVSEHEVNFGTSDERRVGGAACKRLRLIAVLKLAPDQHGWRLPAEYEDIARLGRSEPEVWLFAAGKGWVSIGGRDAFTPSTPTREAIEALPVIPYRYEKTRDVDLELETKPEDAEGDPCFSGEPISTLWVVRAHASGDQYELGPARFDVEVTAPGGQPETQHVRLARGLLPEESIVVGVLPPGTTIRLDPANEVPETSEANNAETLAALPPLVCV